MSGGSFNYLYEKDAHDMSVHELESMAHKMREIGLKSQAEEVQALIDAKHKLPELLNKELVEVMHDIEWWQSGDYSLDQVLEGIEKRTKKQLDPRLRLRAALSTWDRYKLADSLSDEHVAIMLDLLGVK